MQPFDPRVVMGQAGHCTRGSSVQREKIWPLTIRLAVTQSINTKCEGHRHAKRCCGGDHTR